MKYFDDVSVSDGEGEYCVDASDTTAAITELCVGTRRSPRSLRIRSSAALDVYNRLPVYNPYAQPMRHSDWLPLPE